MAKNFDEMDLFAMGSVAAIIAALVGAFAHFWQGIVNSLGD